MGKLWGRLRGWAKAFVVLGLLIAVIGIGVYMVASFAGTGMISNGTGVVTARRPGTATVTVTSGGRTGSTSITVNRS